MKAEELNWGKLRRAFAGEEAQDCVTAIAQDIVSGEVLMVGHANRQAVDHMIRTRQFALWSTSRRELTTIRSRSPTTAGPSISSPTMPR